MIHHLSTAVFALQQCSDFTLCAAFPPSLHDSKAMYRLCVPIANCPTLGVIQSMLVPAAILWGTLYTHSMQYGYGSWVMAAHSALAVCLSLVSLRIRNVHRRFTHLPPPVADYYRLVTA